MLIRSVFVDTGHNFRRIALLREDALCLVFDFVSSLANNVYKVH